MDVTFTDLETAARTVYGEARSESEEGRLAVACVIVNRARKGGWWGNTLEKVCRRRWQFSCWNEGDPNRARLERANLAQLRPFFDAVLAALTVAGTDADPSQGACHYHTPAVSPRWSRGKTPDVVIGEHQFYVGIS